MVLAGGLSLEREVSLASGRRVAQALRAYGIDTILHDTDQAFPEQLLRLRPTVVINALHGGRGEDGTISEILELYEIPYVGQTPASARLAYHKPTAKILARRCGVTTPDYLTLPLDAFREYGADRLLPRVIDRIGLPSVVKPTRGGSGIGLTIVQEASELPIALSTAFACHDTVLIEEFIDGLMLAVTVVDTCGTVRALPAIEIHSKSGIYDYAARYSAAQASFVVPPRAPQPYIQEALDSAIRVHQSLGLRHLTRTDFILQRNGTPQFLEITGSPGLTETSPTSIALAKSGQGLSQLYLQLVSSVAATGPSR